MLYKNRKRDKGHQRYQMCFEPKVQYQNKNQGSRDDNKSDMKSVMQLSFNHMRLKERRKIP